MRHLTFHGSMIRITSVILLWLAIAGGHAYAAEGYIWVEGESAKSRKVDGDNWLNGVKKGQLSGGEWISHWSPDHDGLVEYDVNSPGDGEYTFWVRADPIDARLSYKLNGTDWILIDLGTNPLDLVNLANDDKPDLRNIAWVKVGKVMLKKGVNAVAFKMHSPNNHFGAIDCFVFAAKPFTPRGPLKPGQKLGLSDPNTWAFEPDPDPFDPKAVLDLRGMNEKKAGESGWVTRSPDGHFLLGNGQPVRFWAAGTTLYEQSDEALKEHARFLAKRGVNMVRFFGPLQPTHPGSKITDVNGDQIDKCQRLVAAMKGEGIYTLITPYWAFASQAQESWHIPGHPSGNMFGLLFWDETTQTGYKSWIKELFTRKNPHGGVPLGQEPAVAIFQTQNEDSLLWHSLQEVKGEEKKRLCQRQGAWVIKKYGSLDKANKAWNGVGAEGDDFARGQVGIIELWEYSNDATGGKAVRMVDQLHWLSETMHDFNQMMDHYVHEELGCKVLINAGNWRSADKVKMFDCERWSYTANQVMGVNRYVDFAHVNPTEPERSGSMVWKGDFFEDKSCLLDPRSIPVNCKQVVGYPFVITESTWVPPISYQSEGPFLVATYGSLGGVDIYYWFYLFNVGYDRNLNKWQSATPGVMGGWPAAALLFRKNYVKRGDPVVHEERTLDDLWNWKNILINEEEGFDPNRDSGSVSKQSSFKGAVNPLAYLVGPVEAVYGGDSKKSRVMDLTKFINEQNKVIVSNTGELMLDYRKGYSALSAPKAQGATGFLSKAGPISLGTVTIDSANDYATFLAVALDDKELQDSQKILLQSTTSCRPYHWRQTGTDFQDHEKNLFHGFRIDDTGQEPWNVANTRANILVKNARLTQATQLDANGMPVKDLPVELKNGCLSVKLPPDALYIILQ